MRVCCGLRPMLCVLGCSASAGSIGSERSAVSLPGVTLDSWIGEQEAGTARQEECLGLAQTFCRNLCGEDRWGGRGGFRQGTWQKEVPEYSTPEAGNSRARRNLSDHTSKPFIL